MIKETRSLIRLLRARLHKGVTHQWFLNQYVKKHKLQSIIICNNLIEYDRSKRLISFKNDVQHLQRMVKKPPRIQYNVENATFVLLKDISQVGGGWLGTIVLCSSCINALHTAWVAPIISFPHLRRILTIRTLSPPCVCGYEKRKLLTACKPIDVPHGQEPLGLVSNSFLIPKVLYDINNLVHMSTSQLKHLMETKSKHQDSNILQPLFVSLLQLMFFWLKNGQASTCKLFKYYIEDYSDRIR